MDQSETENTMSRLVALCKRRGFVFPSSEIYGGMNGFWDYGPLGVALKNNIRDTWWARMVERPPIGPDGRPLQIFGLDSSIILNPSPESVNPDLTLENHPQFPADLPKIAIPILKITFPGHR